LKLFVQRSKTVEKTHGSLFCGKEAAKARSEEAGGVTRSFSKEVALDVSDAVGERSVVVPEVADIFFEVVDFIFLP